MEAAEFDKFADEYQAVHARNLRVSGESPEYFARAKIEEIRRRWTGEHRPEPAAILDFGSGIGASLPHLARAFPGAALTALDVSARSLAISAARFPDLARRVLYDGRGDLPLEGGGFDLIFTACVFHHIDAADHPALLAGLHRLLAPGGVLVMFEHNPANPVTRYIVASCPFDENAVLIAPRTLKARLREAGFGRVDIAFTGFFPTPWPPCAPWSPGSAKPPSAPSTTPSPMTDAAPSPGRAIAYELETPFLVIERSGKRQDAKEPRRLDLGVLAPWRFKIFQSQSGNSICDCPASRGRKG